MINYTEKIIDWSIDRNLHNQDPVKQIAKFLEEGGELASALVKNKPNLVKDSIGDIYVVLVVLCTQLNIDINECIELAYNEIKDRTGKIVDGVYVKDEN